MAGNTTTTDIGGATIPEFDLDAGDFLTFETELRDQPLLAMETYNIIGSKRTNTKRKL